MFVSLIDFKKVIEEADKKKAYEVHWEIAGKKFITKKFTNGILFTDIDDGLLGLIHTYDNYSNRKFTPIVARKMAIPQGFHRVEVTYYTQDGHEIDSYCFVGKIDKYMMVASGMFKPVWLQYKDKMARRIESLA